VITPAAKAEIARRERALNPKRAGRVSTGSVVI
jgi:hypothetical protein